MNDDTSKKELILRLVGCMDKNRGLSTAEITKLMQLLRLAQHEEVDKFSDHLTNSHGVVTASDWLGYAYRRHKELDEA